MWTSIRSPTASTISGSIRIELSAPSSWRPPWFDTTIASAPMSSARRASSGSRMPFRMTFPFHLSRSRRILSQSSRGSNCSAVHELSDETSSTPFAWPTMLPKPRRGVCSMSSPQPHFVARFAIDLGVSLGGAERPFLRSLWRCPRIWRSSVSTSVSQPAAAARDIRFSTNSSSRMT